MFLPEFEDVMQPVTHGDSYEEAIYNAREVLELLIESCKAEGKPLPATKNIERLFQIPSHDVGLFVQSSI